jgi:hypothetical protein
MSKFLVLYRAPLEVLDEWMKSDAETRATAEAEMRSQWDEWMKEHAAQVVETAGAGKTKKVSSDGVTDSRNDVMLYAIVEADSHEAAAKMFEGHPHLGIPEASIEVMAINPITGS